MPPNNAKLLKKYGFTEEQAETTKGSFATTGYPQSNKRYWLSWEVYDLSLEEPYFWIYDYIKEYYPQIDKVGDSFSAAENSAFFGVTQQRLGAQQDRVTNILVSVGKMIKELFQMIRELRIIDERLQYYQEVERQLKKPLENRSRSAEVTLKGIFIDLVQGGAKTPASVFGMARELEFVTLPDLFFDAPPFKNVEELDAHINKLGKDFNENVLRVLRRHSRQYLQWKKSTAKEHENRKTFLLKYLKQHYEIIRMYLNWIKPYLRHTAKLTMNTHNMDSPQLVSAFEGSMLDVEMLGKKKIKTLKTADGQEITDAYSCLLISFHYRTRPEMKVVQDSYQRGPVHIGRVDIIWRVYNWTQEELDNYYKFKEDEELSLIGDVSSSVREAMEGLGDELKRYLDEAKGETEEQGEEKKESAKKSVLESWFGDFYTPSRVKAKKQGAGKKPIKDSVKNDIISSFKDNERHSHKVAFVCYKNFKKKNRMVMW